MISLFAFVRKHHDELHTDTVAFEEKYGSQLELIFRFIDRAGNCCWLILWVSWSALIFRWFLSVGGMGSNNHEDVTWSCIAAGFKD